VKIIFSNKLDLFWITLALLYQETQEINKKLTLPLNYVEEGERVKVTIIYISLCKKQFLDSNPLPSDDEANSLPLY
jgi:hypothetical protein